MFTNNLLRSILGILALGALACSDRGSTLVQPGENSDYRSPMVTSVTVTIDSSSIAAGGTAQAVATLRTSRGSTVDRTVTWSSSNSAVASASAGGVISGIGSGTANISASYGSASGSASITVTGTGTSTQPVSSIAVSFASSPIAVGAKTTATATLRDSAGNVLTGRAVMWQSTNTSVATVSATGDVTAIASGTSTIAATSESKLGHAAITISSVAVAPVASATIALGATTLTAGQTTQAGVTLRDAVGTLLAGRTVTWTSSAPGVAKISSTGLVTAVAGGSATMSAQSEGVTATAALTVSASTGTGTLLRSINFEGYSSTAALTADCITFDCVEQYLSDNGGVNGYNAGDVTLDGAANPPGGTKAMRYHYNHPGNGCNTITLQRSVRFPSRQEVWAEFQVKWSANFTTRNDACIPNDHKFIFGDTEADQSGRWALYVGSDYGATHTIKQEIPKSTEVEDGNYLLSKNQTSGSQLFAEQLWNGAWHTIRFHIKSSTTVSSKDGVFQIWIDGVLKHDQGGFSNNRNDGSSSPDFINGFSFSHNEDDGPPNVDMYTWWGAIKIFGTNPGW